MAHALHANHVDKHEPDHKPLFHKHIVDQRCAINAVSGCTFQMHLPLKMHVTPHSLLLSDLLSTPSYQRVSRAVYQAAFAVAAGKLRVQACVRRELAQRRGIPTQEFCVRSDMACGSTIGPILASGLGCRTVDVGAPQV